MHIFTQTSQRRRRLAFLDLLLDLQRKGQMSWREVQEQTDTFMFEVLTLSAEIT